MPRQEPSSAQHMKHPAGIPAKVQNHLHWRLTSPHMPPVVPLCSFKTGHPPHPNRSPRRENPVNCGPPAPSLSTTGPLWESFALSRGQLSSSSPGPSPVGNPQSAYRQTVPPRAPSFAVRPHPCSAKSWQNKIRSSAGGSG